MNEGCLVRLDWGLWICNETYSCSLFVIPADGHYEAVMDVYRMVGWRE